MRRTLNVIALLALVALTNATTVYLVSGPTRGALAGPTDPECQVGDINGDGAVALADAIGLLAYLFTGGFPPGEPFGVCGLDPADDSLVCESFLACM